MCNFFSENKQYKLNNGINVRTNVTYKLLQSFSSFLQFLKANKCFSIFDYFFCFMYYSDIIAFVGILD